MAVWKKNYNCQTPHRGIEKEEYIKIFVYICISIATQIYRSIGSWIITY